jgi:hypothetical protein
VILRAAIAVVSLAGAAAHSGVAQDTPGVRHARSTLEDAQTHFYNGRYDDAAALALELRPADPDNLAVYELRTSALHFQIRRALGDRPDRDGALKECGDCRRLIDEFLNDFAEGRAAARERLKANPTDVTALFFLGKLDLNYVWLQLGTLGRRTGWDEYWEARKSLDIVLKRNPQHVRARVARAWIDYIVDTRMPWGTGWLLGGGNKKKALTTVREAGAAAAATFTEAEADFALWDLHVRERKIADAVPVARSLAVRFPENRDLARFLELYDKK